MKVFPLIKQKAVKAAELLLEEKKRAIYACDAGSNL
jgi:hypothetical protein